MVYKKLKFVSLALIMAFAGCQSVKINENAEAAISKSATILKKAIKEYNNTQKLPRSYSTESGINWVGPGDWTSGFFGGSLWYMFELTNDSTFLTAAEHYTNLLEDEQFTTNNHDVGFMMYCSYGNALRLTKNNTYKCILLQTAKSLSTRYYPNVGSIRSWDFNQNVWQCPVIIDNMMNLELLLWAFHETGDSSFYNIAVSHANTTMQNHYRGDYSCVHVVDYDTITGDVRLKQTHQGYNNESSWARGQAWGLYGFTMMFRETNDSAYLKQAENIASFILNHSNLPIDKVPYWDFNTPNIPNEPRDASAAAIISAALYELSTFSVAKGKYYFDSANEILNSLSTDAYMAGENSPHNFILNHATGNWPSNSEIDGSLNYADYYYLEALKRRKDLETMP